MAASKVPKFGTWENGENYTVYFDNARKKKNNGQIINPNDPEDYPEMLQQSSTTQASQADSKGQKTKVPQFGAWDNGENVGYTEYFEKARKTKNGNPTSEPQMNRDMQPRNDHPARTAPPKTEPQQAQSKVPQFGAWEAEGEGGYTQSFENVRKNKNGRTVNPEPSDAPKNRDVGEPPVKEGRAKVPQFGAWNRGEEAAYTAYFENAQKTKNAGPVLDPVEPQLNRDVNDKALPPSAGGPKYKVDQIDYQLRNASRGSNSSENASRYGKQNPAGQSPLHQKGGKLQQKPPAGRGSQTPEKGVAVPAWGSWNNDPQQAEGYTGAFTRAKEERNTPLNSKIPQRYHQQQNKQDDTKKGCCFGWF